MISPAVSYNREGKCKVKLEATEETERQQVITRCCCSSCRRGAERTAPVNSLYRHLIICVGIFFTAVKGFSLSEL